MDSYASALQQLATPVTLLALVLGTAGGILISSVPGIGPSVAIALLLPLTIYAGVPPVDKLLFLVSLYQAAEYGGSITAIALATPGAPNAAATVLDGYALSRRGQPGKAFGYSLWSAVFASLATTAALLAVAAPVAAFAVFLGPTELAAMDFFALTTVAVLSADSLLKGLTSAALGLLLSTVGIDLISGAQRFTFGVPQLYSGVPLIPLLLGLFAIPEAVRLVDRGLRREVDPAPGSRRVRLSTREFRSVLPATLMGTVVGFVLGLIPGLAGSAPPWISYSLARARSSRGAEFGTGVPDGIVAPEATNAAVMHSTLVPAFFLGIPGTSTSAVILGAMALYGLAPGPLLFARNPTVVITLFEGLLISTFTLWALGILVTTAWSRVLGRVAGPLLGRVSLESHRSGRCRRSAWHRRPRYINPPPSVRRSRSPTRSDTSSLVQPETCVALESPRLAACWAWRPGEPLGWPE